jgi:NADH dehydrogenase [ubiquinone] 1 alpha subcomplex assembly factor 5
MPHAQNNPTSLFDRLSWRNHRERASRRGGVDFLHQEIAARLLDRLSQITRSFRAVLDLGAHSGALSRALATRSGIEQVVALEPSIGFLTKSAGSPVAADPEFLPFRDRSFDLVISSLALHWVADLPGTLVQLRRVLKPDGLLLAAMPGGATLAELRTALIEAELAEEGGASPRVSPTVDLADAAALLQRTGFAMPVADADTITVTYPSILALMSDLRGMGETNALSARRRTMLRRTTLVRAAAIYQERFGLADGRIPATFEIFFLTGWAPDAGQPKPLKPGGARQRLAAALGSVEVSAGDRAAPPLPSAKERYQAEQ